MKITFEKMTQDDFDRILDEIARKAGVSSILAIDGVRELVQEELNNEVLEAWEKENPELSRDWSEESDVINRLGREEVVRLLEDIAGCQCYDSESLETLRTALLENVKDGTVPACELTEDPRD